MNSEFKTQKDLYNRVKPAINAKLQELRRLNYQDISKTDIWRFLIETKWKYAKNLMLSDIVSDIIHLDPNKLYQYLKKTKEKIEEV